MSVDDDAVAELGGLCVVAHPCHVYCSDFRWDMADGSITQDLLLGSRVRCQPEPHWLSEALRELRGVPHLRRPAGWRGPVPLCGLCRV